MSLNFHPKTNPCYDKIDSVAMSIGDQKKVLPFNSGVSQLKMADNT